MTHFLEIMSKFQMACLEFSKSLKSVLNKKLKLADSEESTLFKSMESFTKCLLTHSQAFNETNESIKSTLIDPIVKAINESFQKEKEMYNSYCKIRTIYNNSKSSLQKIHKEFESRAKECETLVYNAKKTKMYSLGNQEQITKLEAKATESIANTALCEDKYINNLNEANKARENETSYQKKLQNYYQGIDNDFYMKIKMMTGFFITCLKKMYTGITIDIDALADKYNRIKFEQDLNEFIEQNKTDAKPDKPICFIPYKPAAESINYTKVTSKKRDSIDLNVSLEVIKTFQKIFKHIRTDLNMDEERKKNRLRLLSNQLFKIENNNDLTKKEKDELFTYLKEENSRTYFMKFLSKLKPKDYKNNEKIFKDLSELSEIFLYILEISESEKDYDSAQNCIILSQTFYNEEKGKKKKYLIDYIRSNKWINSIEFWEGILDCMIQREISKNDKINQNKDEKEKKSNVKNIVFSQVFSYTNNMVEFNIKKGDIISLVDKFCKKYEIEEEMVDSIIENVNNMDNSKNKEEEKNINDNKIIEDQKEEEKKINDNKINEEQKEKEKNEEEKNDNKPKKIGIIKDYFGSNSDIKGGEEEKKNE